MNEWINQSMKEPINQIGCVVYLEGKKRCWMGTQIGDDEKNKIKSNKTRGGLCLAWQWWCTQVENDDLLCLCCFCCSVTKLCQTPSQLLFSLPGSSVRGISQAKIKIEVGCHFPSPEDTPNSGIVLCLLHWQADSLPLSHLGTPGV